MKPELEKLLISERQFQEITGISIDEIKEIIIHQEKLFSHKLQKFIIHFSTNLSIYLIIISVILAALFWLLSQIFGILFVEIKLYSFSSALKISAYFSIPISLFLSIQRNYGKLKQIKTKKNNLKHLIILFNEFKKHNQIVKAIDVKEQLEEVEQTRSDSQVKLTLLKALIEMRQDLIKALKVEKILRENQKVIETNPELFKASFDTTKVQKIIDRGSEYDRLINKTLKIGTEVNKEMKKMKNNSDFSKSNNNQ